MEHPQRRHQAAFGENGQGRCLGAGEFGRRPDHETDDAVPTGVTTHRAGTAVEAERNLAFSAQSGWLWLGFRGHVQQTRSDL